MGKPSRRRSGGDGGASQRGTSKESQVNALLEEADELLGNEQYEEGLSLLRDACKLAPTNVQAVESFGLALAEFGSAEEAVRVLRRAVELQPAVGHEKHMYLGQLLPGQDGISHLRRGVELLQAEFDARPDDGDIAQALSSGLTSLVEALLADCESAADSAAPPPPLVAEECRSLLDRAARAAPSNPEPLQALAALHAQHGQTDAALSILRRSVALWLPPSGVDGAGGASASAAAGASVGAATWASRDPPGYEFRCETAKLLLDLDESTTTAVAVLEGLLEERDDVPEVWFLLGLANHGGCSFSKARMCLDQAEELIRHRMDDAADETAHSLAREVASLRQAVETSAAAWLADGHCDDDDDEEDDGEPLEE